MKKLMIAAVAAAMVSGAFAECQEDTDCVFAYKLTLSGKTTVSLTTKANASKCIEGACYRKPGSFKYVGYVFGTTQMSGSAATCDEGCECNDMTTFNTVVWDNKTKKQVAGVLAFVQLDLINKDAKQAEAVATFNALTLAGFGTYDVKKLYLKSLSGNFAGQLTAPQCETCTYDATTCTEDCAETPSTVFALCTLAADTVDTTAAYGNWSLKYDSSAVKKLTKNYDDSASVLMPKGFVPAN